MKKKTLIYPDTASRLERMGERIKLARLRRNLTAALVCERAGISRVTLTAVEKGAPGVSMGVYAAVLHALGGLDGDIDSIAKDDEVGRTYQDLGLLTKRRVRK